MRPDLIVEFRHCPQTAMPRYLSFADMERIASQVRTQLGHSDADLAFDVERLTGVRAARVNGIPYELEWCLDASVHDDEGQPVFGVCEFDPALPDCAQIHINNDLIGSRETMVRSTCLHEAGHAIVDAPGWIWSHQQQASGLFADDAMVVASRVYRTITSNEAHLTSTPRPSTPEYYREIRANEFMGSVCAPREILAREFYKRCEQVYLDHRIFGLNTAVPLFASGMESPSSSLGAEPVREFDRCEITQRLEFVIRQLATDFGLTPRFITVRLKRYGLVRQEVTIAQ